MLFYSKSTGGFYDSDIHGDSIPYDAVGITADEHQALMDGQSSGKVISHDGSGYPILVDVVESINDVAAAKLAAIQAEKCRVRDGGITLNSVLYDSDPGAMLKYTQIAVFVFSSNPSAEIPGWRASPGQWVTMTQTLLSQLIPLGYANEAAAFAWQEARENEVTAAVAINDIEAVKAVSTTYTAP